MQGMNHFTGNSAVLQGVVLQQVPADPALKPAEEQQNFQNLFVKCSKIQTRLETQNVNYGGSLQDTTLFIAPKARE